MYVIIYIVDNWIKSIQTISRAWLMLRIFIWKDFLFHSRDLVATLQSNRGRMSRARPVCCSSLAPFLDCKKIVDLLIFKNFWSLRILLSISHDTHISSYIRNMKYKIYIKEHICMYIYIYICMFLYAYFFLVYILWYVRAFCLID